MSTPIEAVIIPDNYTITSGGIYDGSLIGGVPSWITTLIDSSTSNSIVPLISDISDLNVLLGDVENGVTQRIIAVETDNLDIHSLITGVRSDVDGNYAIVTSSLATKVTDTEATATADLRIAAAFTSGTAESASWFDSNIQSTTTAVTANTVSIGSMVSTITDLSSGLTATATATDELYTFAGIDKVTGALSATAGYIGNLTASLGDTEIRLDTLEQVTVAEYSEYIGDVDTNIPPAVQGQYMIENNTYYQYVDEVYGWVRTDRSLANDLAIIMQTLRGSVSASDGVIQMFYGPDNTVPTTMVTDDYFLDGDSWTGLKYSVYKYDGASWVLTVDPITDGMSSAVRDLTHSKDLEVSGVFTALYQTAAPATTGLIIGDMWYNTSTSADMYRLDDTFTWVLLSTNTQSTWVGSASKLITDPTTGAVTGWSFADGSNISSTFTISADNIDLNGATTFYSTFDANTDYTNDALATTAYNEALSRLRASDLAAGGTTVIDGARISTGTISLSQITSLASGNTGIGGGSISVNTNGDTYMGSTFHGAIVASSFTGGTGGVSSSGNIYTTSGSYITSSSYVSSSTYLKTGNGEIKASGSLTLSLQSDGNLVWYNGATALWQSGTQVSDERLKSNIVEVTDDAIYLLNKLRVVEFEWLSDSVMDDGGKKHIGFIAQEVELVLPSAVTTFPDNKIVDQLSFMPYVVKALKEVLDATVLVTDESNSFTIGDIVSNTYTSISTMKSKLILGVAHSNSVLRALGNGYINLCSEGGDVVYGDYICSSNVVGKGMKQDDDLMHNYTVAKALSDTIWVDEVVDNVTVFELDGFKWKMVPCTYHCG